MDSELDEYEPTTVFTSALSSISLELSDSYEQRRNSLKRLFTSAHQWLKIVLDVSTYDLKSLLSAYLAERGQFRPINDVALGCSIAAEYGGSISRSDELGTLADEAGSRLTDMKAGFLSQYLWSTAFKLNEDNPRSEVDQVRAEIDGLLADHSGNHSPAEVREIFARASPLLRDMDGSEYLTRRAVQVPFKFFSESYFELGLSLWLYLMHEAPSLKNRILVQVVREWEQSVILKRGLFSRTHDLPGPEYQKMEYAPSNKSDIHHQMQAFERQLAVHKIVIRFLHSAFHSSMFDGRHTLKVFLRTVTVGLVGMTEYASLHPLARTLRFELIRLALDVHDAYFRLSARVCDSLKNMIFDSSLSWFAQRFHWPYGGNRLQLRTDLHLLKEIAQRVSTLQLANNAFARDNQLAQKQHLLLMFLQDELTKLSVWSDPLQSGGNHLFKFRQHGTSEIIGDAWAIDPKLAVFFTERHNGVPAYVSALEGLVHKNPLVVEKTPEALKYFLAGSSKENRRYLLYWACAGPIESINLFLPSVEPDSYIIQYAMRSLESHDVNLVFFYVPQIVQSLRYDNCGYVERFILRTAKISQLFSHQIIWNILANSYKDDEMQEPDSMKPTLDRVVEHMTNHFNPQEKEFYEREFSFFNEVTSISGKLKPYIKKSKAEKKAKIDEEINKIKVDVGVYLPSNPDGVVVAIDRKSGRPLQSHAKAPFLAKFKIRREIQQTGDGTGEQVEEELEDITSNTVTDTAARSHEEVWQGAIFKVGDDCRQDMLALQIVSVFRTIFKDSGLDVYVFPYRVTATAPGCGVIDVLPNSISRDMLGREAVNGLYEYFTSKFGGEDSLKFQKARNAFIKSLAAYSVISYLIQFKDRHNGNIMYDSEGHILHIDFGFCFDIVPGGVKFEQSPFKLTSEMVAVMGGSTKTQAYRWFEELCVKAFLDSRPYAETIIQVVYPMLGSGLPCFKGETTIRKLRARFVLDKSERDAALYFRGLIKKSFESVSTKGYDEFQRITNGIPY
jgi:phosphatidylinositol 4-kinase